MLVAPATAVTITTTRVNVSSTGLEADQISEGTPPSISADGRFVAFWSVASNLVPDDTNATGDAFVHNRQTGTTTRVSVSSSGAEADYGAGAAAISPDGRFVAFESESTNLVPGDTNGWEDVFVHDRVTGTTRRVSVTSTGAESNSHSDQPTISGDGRFVAFRSAASNLVPDDSAGGSDWEDVFVHDQVTGTTTRVSVSSTGTEANYTTLYPAISSDGRFVTFSSGASNLVPGDTNRRQDVFLHDRATATTTRVSVSSTGAQANNNTWWMSSISGDGRFIAFDSEASNLVPHDTNRRQDVFVHDRVLGTTARVSLSNSGAQANHYSDSPSISADGRLVAFYSFASNLVPSDTNGQSDAFVRDLSRGTITRVSLGSGGVQANGPSFFPAIADNARVVAYTSYATNLTAGDTNQWRDVFATEVSP